MNKNMTPIFLLSCSESSLPAMQPSGLLAQWPSAVAVGKQRGDLVSGCDQGTLVLLRAWPWDAWCPCLQEPPRASVVHLCNVKVGL